MAAEVGHLGGQERGTRPRPVPPRDDPLCGWKWLFGPEVGGSKGGTVMGNPAVVQRGNVFDHQSSREQKEPHHPS